MHNQSGQPCKHPQEAILGIRCCNCDAVVRESLLKEIQCLKCKKDMYKTSATIKFCSVCYKTVPRIGKGKMEKVIEISASEFRKSIGL